MDIDNFVNYLSALIPNECASLHSALAEQQPEESQ